LIGCNRTTQRSKAKSTRNIPQDSCYSSSRMSTSSIPCSRLCTRILPCCRTGEEKVW